MRAPSIITPINAPRLGDSSVNGVDRRVQRRLRIDPDDPKIGKPAPAFVFVEPLGRSIVNDNDLIIPGLDTALIGGDANIVRGGSRAIL